MLFFDLNASGGRRIKVENAPALFIIQEATMFIFFVGILEMVVIATWTKLVSETRIMAGGIMTVINVMIWYYVLESVVAEIHNFGFVATYATGCAVGTMVSAAYFRHTKRSQEKTVSTQAS